MKPKLLLLTIISVMLFAHWGYCQPQLQAKIGLNTANIKTNTGNPSETNSSLMGLQTGLGAIFPFSNNFFFSPMLWCTQGGEANKDDQYKWGVRNTYSQLSTTAGYTYALNPRQALQLEAGPVFNYWGRSVDYNTFSGTKEKYKIDLSNNDNIKRTFVSTAAELSFQWKLKPFDLSLGLRGEFGLTPMQKYEDFGGETVTFKNRSLGLVVGFSNPYDDLFGKNRDPSDYMVEIDPDDLLIESLFEETFDSYKEARELVDDAYYSDNPESSPRDLAQHALEELERTNQWLQDGIEAWNNGDENGIGPTTAETLTTYINQLTTRARTMADSVHSVPPEDDGDDPRDTPPPTIYGEEIDPPWISVMGAMEPSQGVWQDDDYFDDKPTKQITEVEPVSWNAELDMVANRWTGVFGLRDDNHTAIRMSGTSTYTQMAPVRFRLKLIQDGNEKIIWTQPASEYSIPIEGGAGPEQSWRAMLIQRRGAPVPKTFLMEPGNYTLEMELIRENGEGTGLKIQTHGNVVETAFPNVHIVPVILSDSWTAASLRELTSDVQRLALECENELPTLLPVPQKSVTVIAQPAQNLRDQELGPLDRLYSKLPFTDTRENVRSDRMVAAMVQKFATGAQLNGGGKVIIVMGDGDFALTDRRADSIGGYAPHEKVLVLKTENYASTVAHELIHSIPFSWADEEMAAECGFSYHNSYDNDYGDGVEVHSWGSLFRNDDPAVMGEVNVNAYISQCSYWHLLKLIQGAVDPELYLVRGFIAQQDGQYYGTLAPTYEFEDIRGLSARTARPDEWVIILRSSSGQELASYPFEALWKDPDAAEERIILPFNHRIDRVAGTATIELHGPDGLKDTQTLSANAPRIKITSPAKGRKVKPVNKRITVEWKASDADGDQLSYLVFYSPDGGTSWIPVNDEQQETSLELEITGNRAKQRVRVMATDGVRTATAESGFTIVR